MIPRVNVDVKMSKSMLNALSMFEAYCIGKNISHVSSAEVVQFIRERFPENLSNKFDVRYLYSENE